MIGVANDDQELCHHMAHCNSGNELTEDICPLIQTKAYIYIVYTFFYIAYIFRY